MKYGGGNARDMDLKTAAWTAADSTGTFWLKMVLEKVHCGRKVKWYNQNNIIERKWTCNQDNCNNCNGNNCRDFTLTVSTEGAVSDLSLVSDCKYGDTVKLENISGGQFGVIEIAIIVKEGWTIFIK